MPPNSHHHQRKPSQKPLQPVQQQPTQQTKAQTSKRQQNRNQPNNNNDIQPDKLKVIVRKLPPELPEQIFWDAIKIWTGDERQKVKWIKWFQGKIRKSKNKEDIHSRAYIQFLKLEDIVAFHSGFDGHLFRDSKGNVDQAIVEFAPYQKVPTPPKKVDNKQGTIEDDPDYLAYMAFLEGKAEDPNPPPAEIPVILPTNPKSTPLLESIRAQKLAEQEAKNKPVPNIKVIMKNKDNKENKENKEIKETKEKKKGKSKGKEKEKEQDKIKNGDLETTPKAPKSKQLNNEKSKEKSANGKASGSKSQTQKEKEKEVKIIQRPNPPPAQEKKQQEELPGSAQPNGSSSTLPKSSSPRVQNKSAPPASNNNKSQNQQGSKANQLQNQGAGGKFQSSSHNSKGNNRGRGGSGSIQNTTSSSNLSKATAKEPEVSNKDSSQEISKSDVQNGPSTSSSEPAVDKPAPSRRPGPGKLQDVAAQRRFFGAALGGLGGGERRKDRGVQNQNQNTAKKEADTSPQPTTSSTTKTSEDSPSQT